jgi:hypothetical protein
MKKNHKDNAFAINEKVMILSPTSQWKGKIGTIEKRFEPSGWYSVNVQGTSTRFKGKNLGKADPSYLRRMQERQENSKPSTTPEPGQATSNTVTPPVKTVPEEEEESLFATNSMVTDDQSDAIPEQHERTHREPENRRGDMENIDHLPLEEHIRILKRELRRMNALVNSMVHVSRCNVNLET